MEKAFKLCDFMSLEDIYVAASILDQYGWDVQVLIDISKESCRRNCVYQRAGVQEARAVNNASK